MRPSPFGLRLTKQETHVAPRRAAAKRRSYPVLDAREVITARAPPNAGPCASRTRAPSSRRTSSPTPRSQSERADDSTATGGGRARAVRSPGAAQHLEAEAARERRARRQAAAARCSRASRAAPRRDRRRRSRRTRRLRGEAATVNVTIGRIEIPRARPPRAARAAPASLPSRRHESRRLPSAARRGEAAMSNALAVPQSPPLCGVSDDRARRRRQRDGQAARRGAAAAIDQNHHLPITSRPTRRCATLRCRGRPSRWRDGHPPLALSLYYLVTAYARTTRTSAHRLLGQVMNALHDHPRSTPTRFAARRRRRSRLATSTRRSSASASRRSVGLEEMSKPGRLFRRSTASRRVSGLGRAHRQRAGRPDAHPGSRPRLAGGPGRRQRPTC